MSQCSHRYDHNIFWENIRRSQYNLREKTQQSSLEIVTPRLLQEIYGKSGAGGPGGAVGAGGRGGGKST